ncbi:MAG: dihydropteroate synthase, partial [Bacteroidaceae bacterium]|nr:dihydropteroate synthase [Bacteroidaceae bacterium]
MMKAGFSLNIKGRLCRIEHPLVMGILNVTPDSFFSGSRVGADTLHTYVSKMVDEGADIIDIGACSTRPGSLPVDEKTELERLHKALDVIDADFPDAIVSIDTFRGRVVQECVEHHNVSIINDVSAFSWDNTMLDAVASARLPYILTHSVGAAGGTPEYKNLLPDVLRFLSEKLWQLRQRGVADVIIDPGFGFGKSVEQNYEMLARLQEFSLLDAPVLVGVSRKSMITKVLKVDASQALNGTTALNMAALMGGAHILRVHDVCAAAETIRLYRMMQSFNK